MNEKDLKRFWSKVDVNGEIQNHVPHLGPCWKWNGTLNNGRAVFFHSGKYRKAYRVCYELRKGPIQEGLLACHKCDNPNCVNPDHIFIGTQNENIQDKIEKGRQLTGNNHPMRKNPELASRGERHSEIMRRVAARGDRHSSRTHPEKLKRGADNKKAKLNEHQVLEIRRLYAEKSASMNDLGIRYGVYHTTICAIVNRKTWAHI